MERARRPESAALDLDETLYGVVIGEFLLGEPIGEGGTAVVHRHRLGPGMR